MSGANPVRAFFGVLLMAVGALIALATGLCVWIVGGSSLGGGQVDSGSQIMSAMTIGAIPMLIGLGLIVGGWFLAGFGKRKGPP
jgi:hypothetical protein